MATNSEDKRLIDNASATTVDNFYGNKSGADVQIPLATAASVLAAKMGIYIGEVSGTDRDDLTEIAREVINVLPNNDVVRFSYIHDFYGRRLVEGYVYGDKKYGVVQILDFLKGVNVVRINNGEYTIQ